MKPTSITALLLGLALASSPVSAADPQPAYANNFEKLAANATPEDFLILNGTFEVKEEGGNKFIEIPGAPLDSYGALFGPTQKQGVSVSGRGFGTGKGRRFPTFGVGLNGAGGYRLQVSPGKKQLELFKGDTSCTGVPFDWQSGKWIHFKLQVRKTGDAAWIVEGKSWTEGGQEPKDWMLAWTEKEEPVAGRAAIWCSPYSTTPIRFDDLSVAPLNP